MRALVVEDDPVIGADVMEALGSAGFTAELSIDGEDAWFRGDVEDFVLVVLDLGLPRLDGLTLLRRWRASARHFPVLILSARGDWMEKVEGIEAGADDYLAKPFEMGELLTRARALIRRAAGHASATVSVGRLTLNTSRMIALMDGCEVKVSPLEFRLLNCLAHNPATAMSAGALAEQLYGVADSGDANAIEALVMRLRRKLGANAIETRRGFGYVLAGSA